MQASFYVKEHRAKHISAGLIFPANKKPFNAVQDSFSTWGQQPTKCTPKISCIHLSLDFQGAKAALEAWKTTFEAAEGRVATREDLTNNPEAKVLFARFVAASKLGSV